MILSDKGMTDALQTGKLKLNPFELQNLGPCSYDLTVETIWQVPGNIEDDELPMEEFLKKYGRRYDGILLPGHFYIGRIRESFGSDFYMRLTSRSGIARLGIEVRDMNLYESQDPRRYCMIRTYGTTCEMPEGQKMAQLILSEGLPLGEQEMQESVTNGVVGNRNARIFRFNTSRNGFMPTSPAIMLTAGNRVKRYNGKPMRFNENNDGCFSEIDITGGYEFEPKIFYLAFTDEIVAMPNNHAGMLIRLPKDFGFGYIHPNAPLISPGSEGNQVLEVYYPQGRYVRDGDPFCGLELHKLDRATNPYNGKYRSQRGAQTSLLHRK